ncbi:MAG: DegT/DnrJ/EryC1/StrS aminotransferase family protein, partial [Candidatus Magasanikbacteria bacterium]
MIKLIKSTFFHESEVKEKLVDFIRSADVLSMGANCFLFEKQFSAKQQRRNAVFVSSGSMANLVLVQALLNLGRLKKGDRVGVSALTWSTNVMPIIQLGLEPVILDVELNNLNTSLKILKETHKKTKLKALFLTNALGFSADIDSIKEFCNQEKIIFLEDNCEALGSKVDGKLLGNFGLASTFSSFVGHHFSTIEGGMICTDDDELHQMLLMVRAHGWDRNLNEEQQTKLRNANKVDDFYARYTFYDLAYNARPTEIQGFIGQSQLVYWDEIVSKRESNFKSFTGAVKNNKDIIPLEISHLDLVSNFAMPLVFKTNKLFLEYKDKFIKSNVEIRPIIAGNISNQPFFKKYIKQSFSCPNAEYIHKNGFYFGNNPEMTEA